MSERKVWKRILDFKIGDRVKIVGHSCYEDLEYDIDEGNGSSLCETPTFK